MLRHVNGRITISEHGRRFECLEGQFATIEPDYAGLPAGVVERRYNPGASGGRPKHVLITEDRRQIAGALPFPEGDVVLSRVDGYRALLEVAFPPLPAEAEERCEKPLAPPAAVGTTIASLRAEIRAMREALIDAGVWRA